MVDKDGDRKADRIVLTYSEKIRHARDGDGTYPFSVAGYRIKKVLGARSSKTLTILVREKAQPDLAARPTLTYTRTKSRPVRDLAKNQARRQSFRKTIPLDRTPPQITGARMLDRDRDDKADGVALSYSEPVRHAADSDGSYPFTVATYGVTGVSGASGSTLTLSLREKAASDIGARPSIAYARTVSGPVTDAAGNQAKAQTFSGTTPLDPDNDGGTVVGGDCAPANPAIGPAEPDVPDVRFVDSNCDGIDGTAADAIFVSPLGADANAGTRNAPMLTLPAAIAAASAAGKDVFLAGGEYASTTGLTLVDDVSIYGSYNASTWQRDAALNSVVSGAPQAVLADGVTGVTLQHLRLEGKSTGVPGSSVYGLRGINGSNLRLERVTIVTEDGVAGANGSTGFPCFFLCTGRPGGAGGAGGQTGRGQDGTQGQLQQPGAGGIGGTAASSLSFPGGAGGTGAAGGPGAPGAGATNEATFATHSWVGRAGDFGDIGGLGHGGGGGGGGHGFSVFGIVFPGGNGGNGGNGGGPGGGGSGGGGGGGSFAVYLFDSTATVVASTLNVGAGGAGGNGGEGANGAPGQLGAPGLAGSSGSVGGAGGTGGAGGKGGRGGGGAGGPSVGVFQKGAAPAASIDGATNTSLAGGGAGGAGGNSGETGVSQPLWRIS